MKGSNTIVINGATITEAMQEYFDKRTTEFARFKVLSVKATAGQEVSFQVKTEEPEPKPKPKENERR